MRRDTPGVSGRGPGVSRTTIPETRERRDEEVTFPLSRRSLSRSHHRVIKLLRQPPRMWWTLASSHVMEACTAPFTAAIHRGWGVRGSRFAACFGIRSHLRNRGSQLWGGPCG